LLNYLYRQKSLRRFQNEHLQLYKTRLRRSGILAIPGLGPFIAADPIMAVLAGLGVGGAVGGVAGALIGMGIPGFEAKRYEGRLHKGGILLSVHCDTAGEITRAKEILIASGAEDISSTGEFSVDGKTTDRDAASKAARGIF
jgi:hypothetical protein